MPSFGLTAFETTTGKQAELLVDNGELRVSGSSSGGVPAKAPNATESTMASVGVFGSNAAGNAFQSLKCDASGHLLVSADGGGAAPTSVTIKGNDGDNGAGTSRTIKSSANGELFVKVLGNEEADGSGTSHNLHLDGSGNTFANIVNTVFVAPANDTNSKVTDAPANSMAVGLQGRTTIGTGSTSTFLLCDANGHLAVEDKSLAILEPTIVQSETTQVQRVNLALHDVGNSNMRTAKCDTDGNLFVYPQNNTAINGTSVQVGVDSGTGSNYQGVSISGFDDPTNPSQFNSSKVDTTGNVYVNWTTTPNIKLEDISSTLDADNVNNSRSLPMTMKGRTSINDHTTGTYLLTDADGHLQVDVLSGGGSGGGNGVNLNGTFETLTVANITGVEPYDILTQNFIIVGKTNSGYYSGSSTATGSAFNIGDSNIDDFEVTLHLSYCLTNTTGVPQISIYLMEHINSTGWEYDEEKKLIDINDADWRRNAFKHNLSSDGGSLVDITGSLDVIQGRRTYTFKPKSKCFFFKILMAGSAGSDIANFYIDVTCASVNNVLS